MKLYWQEVSKQTGGDEVEATERNKDHKAPGKKPFVTQALTEIPLSGQSNNLSVQRSTLKYWPLWASLLSLTHSILFCFNSFQEAEKVTLSKWPTPAVSHSSYHANSKTVHILPGNPTSSTGAKESGTITRYTIFNVFTPLTSGILPKDGVLLLRELPLQCPHFSSTQTLQSASKLVSLHSNKHALTYHHLPSYLLHLNLLNLANYILL